MGDSRTQKTPKQKTRRKPSVEKDPKANTLRPSKIYSRDKLQTQRQRSEMPNPTEVAMREI